MMSSVLCYDILALKMMMIIVIIIIIIPRVLLSTLDNTIIIIIIMSAERGRERERGYTTCRGKEIKGVGAKAQIKGNVTYTKPSTRDGRVGKHPSHIWALKHHRVTESL